MQPTRRMVLTAVGLLPLALLPVWLDESTWVVWAGAFAVLLAVGILDAWLGFALRDTELRVTMPTQVYVGDTARCGVSLRLPEGDLAVDRLECLLDADEELGTPDARHVALGSGSDAEASFDLRPERRGRFTVTAVWLRWRGPLGLLEFVQRRDAGAHVDVVPNIAAVRDAAMRFFSRTSSFGVKAERFIGDGSEFESLRQYVPGLDARSIDWKATARSRRIMCRRFRAERNHQIILAFDHGHLMGEPIDGVPRVDHAINRGLLLGYIGLRTGDRVGMYGFAGEPGFFVEPQGGVGAFPRLQATSAAIEYDAAETNFTLGILSLAGRLRRRSLVVVFTEFVDSVTAQLMVDNLDRLAKRHVVLFVALRDPSLEELEQREPTSVAQVGEAVVAAELRRERKTALQRLTRCGVHVVDAPPSRVGTDLINRYLEIKRRELV